MYRWWHFLAENAARALTIPDVPASDLPVLIHSRWNASCQALRGIRASRCEPIPVFPLPPGPSTSPAWLSATSATARCEACSGVPAATCTRYRRRPVRGTLRRRGISADAWNLAAPWNIAVRTRGVFTHHDDFQKPACAEWGLVRTVIGSDQAAVPRFLTITQFPKKSIRS